MSRACGLGLILAVLGGTPQESELRLRWVRELPRRKSAWEYTPKMVRDTAYEPVAAGGLVVLGREDNGAVLALDAETGEERWTFSTEGPIRTAPGTDGERFYVGSDDGHLYALEPSGRLLWKFRGGPSGRKVIGHERLISAWPVSARPLAAGGRVYVTTGYWPVDGIQVHALDAATGKAVWSNRSAQFRPFGSMRIVGTTLFVEGHHGNGAFDVETGASIPEKPPAREPAAPTPVPPAVKGTPQHVIRADGRVVVSTAEGTVFGFGVSNTEPRIYKRPDAVPAADASRADEILEASRVRRGYALVAGLSDGALVEGLVRRSELHVVAVDPDPEKTDRVRRRLDPLFESRRLSVLAGTEGLPPYFASLVCSESGESAPEELRECLRPYGGVWVSREGSAIRLARREGPLPGAADWTHEMANAAMTLASRDKQVRAPLGLLWYGGPAADLRFYFDGDVDHQSGHGINPQPTGALILEGRMILQGPGVLGAFDIYTGRPLWETRIPRMYTFGGAGGGLGIHSKKHPEPWNDPEALKVEVPPTHHPRASGFNMACAPDAIYLGAGEKCLAISPEDGRVVSSWGVPLPEPGLCWGNFWISGNTLVATAFRPQDLADAQAGHDGNGGDWAGDRMPMAWLFAVDRRSGKLSWTRKASWGFLNRGVAVGKGTVFALDLLMDDVLKKLRAAGRALPEAPPKLHALDLESGRERWDFTLDVLVKTLHYSLERDLLVVACRHLVEWKEGAWTGGSLKKSASGKMRGFRGADGKVLWEVAEAPYAHPHIVLGDLLIDRWGNAFDLLTGKRHRRESILAEGGEEWSFPRGGCNHLVAGESLVTWRTAFYDLGRHAGVQKLAGMDAGCTATLLPAGGVLNVPDFGTHHKRNRMTALALVHRPENEFWPQYAAAKPASPVPIRRTGFAFGAPGDRIAEDGTLWLRVGPRSEAGSVKGEVEWFESRPGLAGSPVASFGVMGAAEVALPTRLPLGGKEAKSPGSRRYDVRLTFVEPRGLRPGERVFNVALEGKIVLQDFDILAAGGGPNVPVVREFKGIDVTGPLEVTLTSKVGKPLICGVEIVGK